MCCTPLKRGLCQRSLFFGGLRVSRSQRVLWPCVGMLLRRLAIFLARGLQDTPGDAVAASTAVVSYRSESDSSEEQYMSPAKKTMIDIIVRQPDDSTYDEIIKELAFSRMIDR